MPLTIEISDELARQVESAAALQKRSVTEFVEQDLRSLVHADSPLAPQDFDSLPSQGGGFTPEFENAPFSKILEASYPNTGDLL
ncbi:MAG: hypothetical protein ACFBZ8_11680 [Opitutales bacterium]